MLNMPANNHVFYLSQAAYKRTRSLAWLLVLASLTLAIVCALLSVRLWSSYTHIFTPYLKWQDALLATLCYISLILIVGSAMVVRFHFALRAGIHQGMFIQTGAFTIVVRDLSSKNLSGLYWAIGTTLSCFLVALVGLIPEILIGWTIHLPHPLLVVICTGVAILLSLAGLVVTLVATSFIIIGWIGCFSFCRKMGAPQTYQLDRQTTVRLDGFVLSISHPHQQEVVLDLNQLDFKDQHLVFSLLHKRWLEAEHACNSGSGEDIGAKQTGIDRFTMLV